MEQPFGENEVRYFLAEILKTSSIAPLDLMAFIQERGIQPSWYEMSLPYGRSVSSCMGVWQHLSQPRFTAPVPPMVAFEQQSAQNTSKPKKKRPASGENVPSVADRMIQPQQPSNFRPVNAGDPATNQVAPTLVQGGPSKKKRGRPSKVEHEARVAEAAARGEEYKPTPRRKKTPRPPPQGTPNAGVVTPSMTEFGIAGEVSTGKKKARKPNAALEETSSLTFGTPGRNIALEATAHAADKMQIEEDKPAQSTMPETQASDFEARESLLANMREHAEQFAPATILQHDSTPQHNFISYQGPTRDPATTGEQHFL